MDEHAGAITPRLRSQRELSSAAGVRAEGACRLVRLQSAARREAPRPAEALHWEQGRWLAARVAPGPGIHRRRRCGAHAARLPVDTDRRLQRRDGLNDGRGECDRGGSGRFRRAGDARSRHPRSSHGGHAAPPRTCWRTDSSPPPATSELSETLAFCKPRPVGREHPAIVTRSGFPALDRTLHLDGDFSPPRLPSCKTIVITVPRAVNCGGGFASGDPSAGCLPRNGPTRNNRRVARWRLFSD
jgi:hypothetical protein